MATEMREKLIEILRVPIYPHEQADPAEVVADYLLDNDVVPVVRCGKCIHRVKGTWAKCQGRRPDEFCSDGDRRTHRPPTYDDKLYSGLIEEG